MPISKLGSLAAALFTAALLQGCLATDDAFRDAPGSIAVTSAGLIVSGPPGYCIDPSLSRNGRDRGFVLFGNCAAISNRPLDPQPNLPVVLSATVALSDAPLPATAEIDDFIRSDAGRRELGISEDSGTLATRTAHNAVIYHLSTGRKGDSNWRALFGLRGAIFSLSMRPLSGAQLTERQGFALLEEFTVRIQAANRDQRLATRNLNAK